jgi:thioredoxin 2
MGEGMEKIKVVCPSCNALNMVAASENLAKANCGKCQYDLLDNEPVILDSKNYDKFTVKGDLPIVVDFWADWCNPCKMMAPYFKEASKSFVMKAKFGKLDTENNRQISGKYGIRGIPTMIVFKHGKELGRISGALPAAKIVSWLEGVIK